MILGAGPLQVPAIKILKNLGYKVIACDYDPNAVGFEYVDIGLLVSTIDKEEILKQAKIYKPDFIMTSTSDAPVKTVAYVSEKLGKRVDISYEDAICATEKHAMRNRLEEYGVPIPRYFVCHSYNDFKSAVENFQDICVIKPSDNAASRGVELLNCNCNEKEKYEKYEYTRSFSRNGIILLEEYMDGPEVSVEGIIQNKKLKIIAITDKNITEKPYFVEIGHSEPSMIDNETKDKIKKITELAVGAIGINNGVCHTELKITSQGPKVVEVAARLGGDNITSKLVPISTGVDIVKASVMLALGKSIEVNNIYSKGSAIRFIYAEKEGILNSILVDECVKKFKGVEEIEFYVKSGDRISTLHNSNDRLGHIITSGNNAVEAIERAESILKHITLNYK